MLLVKKFVIRENDYGQSLHFWLTEADKTAYEINGGSTVSFEAYVKGSAVLLVDDNTHVTVPVQTGDDIGHCYYTTQSADFGDTSAGWYWCRMKVDNITSDEVELEVLDELSA